MLGAEGIVLQFLQASVIGTSSGLFEIGRAHV